MRRLPECPEIFYHPPKSASFGHSSVPRKPEPGWQRTLLFLDTLANYTLREDAELRIHFYPQWNDARVIERCIQDAAEQFGDPARSDGPMSKAWAIPASSLPQAVAFALRDSFRPTQEIGPTWLSLTYDFSWKPHPLLPASAHPGEGSYLGVIHGGRKLFLQPTFRFPFEAATPEFVGFVAHVQTHLPFKFREQNFKILLPSPNGKSPRIRNLPVGWLAA